MATDTITLGYSGLILGSLNLMAGAPVDWAQIIVCISLLARL